MIKNRQQKTAICQTCGKDFIKPIPRYTYKYCSPECSPAVIRRAKKQILQKLYGNKCSYCGIKLEGYSDHIDHIVPKYRGGSDELDNLALSCTVCNMAKGAMPVDNFLDWLDYIRSDKFNSPIIDRLYVNSLIKQGYSVRLEDD